MKDVSLATENSSFILQLSSLGRFFASPIFLLFAFSVFALAPLTAPGYFSFAHDARHSVYFLQMFDMSIRDGAWFPRWAADMTFGYGYPLWLILAPIPFFVGEAVHLVGFDFVSAVKIVDGLAVLFSALTMYLFAARVLGKNAGLVAAIAYVYIPYHLVDLYVRASQAELVSFVFPPLVCWAFHGLVTTRHTRYIAFAALAYAGLVLSHMAMTVLFTPIIGLYILFLLVSRLKEDRKPKAEADRRNFFQLAASRTLPLAFSLALALGIAAIFWLPVLFEQRYLTSEPLVGGFFNYRKHFLNANQLLSPFWGYGYAGENGNDQFSLQLGLIPVLFTFIALWGWNRVRGEIRAHIGFFALILFAVVLLVLPISAPLWEPFASIIAFAQFPWRLLIISAFALAFLSGAAMHALDDTDKLAPMLAAVLLLVTANYPYTQPQHTEAVFNYQTQMEFEVKYGELLGDTIWMTGARPTTSPLVPQYIAGEKLTKAIALDDFARVETIRYGGQSVDVHVESNQPARVLLYTHYFPGWTATIDNRPIDIEPFGEQGLILVNAPAGSHIVALRFQDTPIRQIGTLASMVSVIIALAIWRLSK